MSVKTIRFIYIFLVVVFLSSIIGCSILDKSKQEGQTIKVVKLIENKPLDVQLQQSNTIYEICGNFDLQGGKVTIPEGCSLKFVRGSISNGTLEGEDTYISLRGDAPIFNNVFLKGSFKSEKFPINAYSCESIDYFYSFLEAFSGTRLYLSEDYCATKYLGVADGTTPASLIIDGRGYKLTLYSFGAYKVQQCSIKDITIECKNNIEPKNKWKSDKFTFGIVGNFDKSTLELNNVSFTKECGFAYIRAFKKLDVKNCSEDESYFFVYDCDNVTFHNNSIVNAANGYYSIGRMTEFGQVKIYDNQFHNIHGGGIILSGGIKYNVSIINNIIENVGAGGAMKSCINIHPRGVNYVKNNSIVANVGASTLDIDAARKDMFSENTIVFVENNEIRNAKADTSIHSMALVGLGKLYFRNNRIKDQQFFFWDTPYLEFSNNIMSYSKGFVGNTNIGSMSTHEITENIEYQHIYKDNKFVIPSATGYVKFEYLSKAKVYIEGEGNIYTEPIDFVDQYKKFEASGDIRIYK